MPEDSGHFSEVVDAPEFLPSLEILLYDFYKTPGVPGVPGVPGHFFEVVEALECL